MKIQLINLDRSTDRLTTFKAVNAHLMPHIVRFSAVEGKDVNRAVYVERGIVSADLGYKDGALGSALSQIALWDFAIREDRMLTICEDDAVFNRDFSIVSEAVLRELPPDWHLIKWGWNFDSHLCFDVMPGVSDCVAICNQESLRKAIDVFKSAQLNPRPYRLHQAFGNVCYSVSSRGARLLRQNCLPLRNTTVYVRGLKTAVTNYCIDVALNALFSHMNSFVCVPPLVVTANDRSTSLVQR
jgi:glycosyl transferase family 25